VQTVTITKTQGAKMGSFRMVEFKCYRYATRSTPLEWQTDRFIWAVSCGSIP